MSDLLILEWCPDCLRALVVGAGSRPSVRSSSLLETVDHADPHVPATQAGESVRAWLAEQGISADQTIVVVPREAVVMRKLQLPQAPPDELPELVRFQAATRTSAPIDTLTLDYLPLPISDPEQGQDVISFTMDRETLQRIQTVCQTARLDLQQITVSSLTVGEYARTRKAQNLGMDQPDLVVYQQGRRLELSIFDFGTLVFSHSTQLAEHHSEAISPERLKPFKSDLARCLVTLNQEHPQANVGRCFYIAGAVDAGVVDLLEQRFSGNVIRLEAADPLSVRVPAGYEAAYGAAIPASDGRLRLDLLHPRRRKEVPDRRKWYYGVGAVIAMLAIALAYSVFHSKKSALENSIQTLQADINTKTDHLKKGKPKADAYDRLARWKEGDADPIDLWNSLRSQLASTDRVYLTEVRVIPLAGEMQARYVGRGQARARADVDVLNQLLSDNGFRVRPTTARAGNRDPEYPWEFDLDVELPRSLAVALMSQTPPASPATPSK